MPNEFHDSELLFRAIKINPTQWKDNKPTSAVFKDSWGVSVDRQKERDLEECVEVLKRRFSEEDIQAVIHVSVKQTLDAGATPIYDPIEGNQYHSLIKKSETEVKLTGSTAKKLSENCKVCYQKD